MIRIGWPAFSKALKYWAPCTDKPSKNIPCGELKPIRPNK